MKKLLAMIMALGSVGCTHLPSAPTATPIYLSTGERGYQITCEERGLAKDSCYRKAGELCRTLGYEEIPQESGRQMNDVFDMVTGAISQGKTMPILEKTIVVKCKRPSTGDNL
jgi:hypothetical protein